MRRVFSSKDLTELRRDRVEALLRQSNPGLPFADEVKAIVGSAGFAMILWGGLMVAIQNSPGAGIIGKEALMKIGIVLGVFLFTPVVIAVCVKTHELYEFFASIGYGKIYEEDITEDRKLEWAFLGADRVLLVRPMFSMSPYFVVCEKNKKWFLMESSVDRDMICWLAR